MSLTSRLLPANISSNPAFNVPTAASPSHGAEADAVPEEIDDERRFGRFPGMLPPVDMFADRLDREIEVHLGAIDYYPSSTSVSVLEDSEQVPRDGVHWMIRWQLQDFAGCAHFRMLHVLTERILLPPSSSSSTSSTSPPPLPSARSLPVYKDIYTNWGPMTKSQDAETIARSLFVPLGVLTLAQRRALERIAESEPVREPDGRWNCQDWVKSVLWRAVGEGLFEDETVREALGVVSSDAHLKAWLQEHKD